MIGQMAEIISKTTEKCPGAEAGGVICYSEIVVEDSLGKLTYRGCARYSSGRCLLSRGPCGTEKVTMSLGALERFGRGLREMG